MVFAGRSGHYGLGGIRERARQTRLQVGYPEQRRERHGDRFESSGFDGGLRIGGEIPFATLPPEGGGGVVSPPLWPPLPSEASGRAQIVDVVSFPSLSWLTLRFEAFEAPRHLEPVPYSPCEGLSPQGACHQARFYAPGGEA